MRRASVSEIKQNRILHHDDKPREGTLLRRMHDLFLTGEVINVRRTLGDKRKNWATMKMQLRVFYGLELECTDKRRGVRCTGVWDGPYLVPIERICDSANSEGNE